MGRGTKKVESKNDTKKWEALRELYSKSKKERLSET